MSGEEPAPQIAPVEYPQMISTIKLPMLKKGEYTLWSIRMEQYLTNTDYGLWHVIMNGDELVQTTKDENGVKTEVPPKTAQALLQRQKERKAKSTLLLAILNEYQLRFHVVSNEDANQKFLRALPSSWNNIALIMRNKEGIDELDIDDLYNNLKVFKADIKGSSGSFSNSQNMAFLSIEDTNSINEVSTINGVSTAAGHMLGSPKWTQTKKLRSLEVTRQKSSSKDYGSYNLFAHLKKRFMPRASSDQLADNLHDVMMETLPSSVKEKVTEQVKKEIQNAIDNVIPSLVDAFVRSYMSGHILHVHPAQVQASSVPEQQHQLYLATKADPRLQQQDIAIWLALRIKFEQIQVQQTPCRPSAIRTRDQNGPHDDAHPEGENSAKRQKTSEY
ncbi:hypothetical protein Tco_0578810 [Tanacetum coccineum]